MSATLIAKLAFKSTSLSNLNSSILDFSSLLHFSPWNCGGSPKWYEYQIETVRQCRNDDEHLVSNAVRTRLWFQMSWDLVVFCCWYIYQANIAHPRSNQYWLSWRNIQQTFRSNQTPLLCFVSHSMYFFRQIHEKLMKNGDRVNKVLCIWYQRLIGAIYCDGLLISVNNNIHLWPQPKLISLNVRVLTNSMVNGRMYTRYVLFHSRCGGNILNMIHMNAVEWMDALGNTSPTITRFKNRCNAVQITPGTGALWRMFLVFS